MNKRRSDYPFSPGYDPKHSSSAPIFNMPAVVIHLLIVLVGVFVVLSFAPDRWARTIEVVAALSPPRFLAGPSANGGLLGMAAPLIGHIFIHANLTHLAFNSVWLLAFGTPVARRLGAGEGRKSFRTFARSSVFVTFFVICGIVGALTYIWVHSHENTLLVGASGGVSGLLGGLVRFAFSRSAISSENNMNVAPLTDRSVILWSLAVILLNAFIGVFGGAILGAGDNQIAWEAHIGGYLFGLLTFGAFDRFSRHI